MNNFGRSDDCNRSRFGSRSYGGYGGDNWNYSGDNYGSGRQYDCDRYGRRSFSMNRNDGGRHQSGMRSSRSQTRSYDYPNEYNQGYRHGGSLDRFNQYRNFDGNYGYSRFGDRYGMNYNDGYRGGYYDNWNYFPGDYYYGRQSNDWDRYGRMGFSGSSRFGDQRYGMNQFDGNRFGRRNFDFGDRYGRYGGYGGYQPGYNRYYGPRSGNYQQGGFGYYGNYNNPSNYDNYCYDNRYSGDMMPYNQRYQYGGDQSWDNQSNYGYDY